MMCFRFLSYTLRAGLVLFINCKVSSRVYKAFKSWPVAGLQQPDLGVISLEEVMITDLFFHRPQAVPTSLHLFLLTQTYVLIITRWLSPGRNVCHRRVHFFRTSLVLEVPVSSSAMVRARKINRNMPGCPGIKSSDHPKTAVVTLSDRHTNKHDYVNPRISPKYLKPRVTSRVWQ
jgi:hypothetical protein